MNAGGDGKPDSPEKPTPQPPESGLSGRSEAKSEPVAPQSAEAEPVAPKSGVSRMAADSASGATEGLPPDKPLPPGAEMLRRASGSSIDSFSGEGGDLNLLVAEQFQRRYAHFEVEMGPDGKPIELGRGAMGITYKASDTTLRRPVALKVISSRLLHNESLKNRFLREARAAASLRHPYVASIYYLGSTEASYFYAMELIEGQTLEAYINQHGPLDVKLALEIAIQIASALAAAHQAGLVHRDIKPANIILTRDSHGQLTAKVIDFGLVKLATGDIEESSASEPGIFLGTPRYASPEQISCGAVDIRSDLYSVGVTLWQMLTKAAPFIGTPSEVAAQHLQAPLPISKLKHFPQPMVALLTHLLEKDPKDRPQTPDDLLAILRATQRSPAGNRTLQKRAPVLSDQQKRLPRRKSYIFGGGAFLIAAGLGAYFYFSRPNSPPVTVSEKSVAVLPFDNVGGGSQKDYLSDGLTTEVIFQLSKIADLRVISRDSVLAYKATEGTARKPLPEIARELGVQTVLESSVQQVDDRVNIIAVLYDAKTGRRLWGASYHREMKDLFAIQTDVAENLAAALKVHLSPDEQKQIAQEPTQNVAAYDLYLQGAEFLQLLRKDDNEKAIALFRQAIEADPKFALGHVGLAQAYLQRVDRFDGEAFLVDSAIDLCQSAIELDPDQVRAYTTLGLAFDYKGMDEAAGKQIAHALALAPNDATANSRAAYEAGALGHVSDEYALLFKSHQIAPKDPAPLYHMAAICAWTGERERMEKWMATAIALETNPDRRVLLQAERFVFLGNWQNAMDQLRKLPLELRAYNHTVSELLVACSAKLGDWNTVGQIARTKLGAGTDVWDWKMWGLVYLALADQGLGQPAETKTQGEALVNYIQQKFVGREISHWEAFYLAVGERLLGNKEEAYARLRPVFSPAHRDVPLMGLDPLLSPFQQDPEYQDLMNQLQGEIEKTKGRIEELENLPDSALQTS
jgi:serine/threonine protein kinase/tetratricopeptide (TPR) repeat protein